MAERLLTSIISNQAPDVSFIILAKDTSNKTDLYVMNYNNQDNRLKSVGSIQTVLDMNGLASRALQIIDPNLYFAPDFPDFLLPTSDPLYQAAPQVKPRVITWGTVRKEPGTVGGKAFQGTQEIKPRHREALAIFANKDSQWIQGENLSTISSFTGIVKYIEIKAQVFDNLVQYNIWSKSNYEVEELTEWFEQFMEDYRGMFLEAGINQMMFNRRVRDDTLIAKNNGYHVRSVLYYVRTERVLFETVLPIDRINIKMYVNDLNSINESLSDHIIGANLYDKIVSNWVNKK